MSKTKKIIWFGLASALAFSIYVLNFGLWPRYFDIAWDEEVKLHDGRVIIVHIKRTYQRIGLRLEKFPQVTYFKSMEFSFDTGFPMGKFKHIFTKPGDLNFIDFDNDKWYIGYYSDPVNASFELGSRHLYPHVAIVNRDGSIIKPTSWDEIPLAIANTNIMPPTPNINGIAHFNNSKLTVDEKNRHWGKYPTGAGEHTITRITTQPIQKETK